MILSLNGIVLKSTSYSESSLISRIFTNEFGKLSVITRGAKKIKGGLSGLLQPMNILELQLHYNKTRDIQVLKEVALVKSLENIRSNIKKIAIGLVMIEILDKTTEILDKSEVLYRLIQKSLIALNNTQINNMLLLLFYKIQFSKYSGFNPVPEFCHECNNKLENTYYNKKNGYLYCNNCIRVDGFKISKNIYNFLIQLSTTHITKLNLYNINNDSKKIIEKYLTHFMIYHLQGMYNLKSFKFLNQVISS